MTVKPYIFADFGYFESVLMRKRGIDISNKPQKKIAILVALAAWVPLFILSIIEGYAFGDAVKIPFIFDFAPHIRFLVAIPILFAANTIINPRLAFTAEEFLKRDIIPPADRDRYVKLSRIFERLNKSPLDEIVIFIIAYIWAIFYIYIGTPVNTSTWTITISGGERAITAAGWWYLLVSTPIYQFLIFRWLWRFNVWLYFLYKVSKMDLNLIPSHPDGMGSLGFLTFTARSFGILIFCSSLVLSATIANAIAYAGASFFEYEKTLIAVVIVLTLFILLPSLFFAGHLIRTKRRGLLEYGNLASIYTRRFHLKWIKGESAESEELLGTGDIQSLADLANSYSVIQKMNLFPFDLQTVLALVMMGAMPMLPLLLTAVPIGDIFKAISGVVL
jgi:hypothetical protein